MRAILCLCLPETARSGRRAPWSAPELADAGLGAVPWTVDPATGLYCVLPDAATWDTLVSAARALLARLAGSQAGAGLAQARFPAACAARLAAPGALLVIAPGQEAPTLAPLPVALLPGLPAALHREFQALRVLTLGDLAALPTTVLAAVFGAAGLQWQALARGLDSRPVECSPSDAAGAALTVRLALPPALRRVLEPADLAPLTAGLAAGLAAIGRAASILAATVGFVDGTEATRTARLSPAAPAADGLQGAAWPLVAGLLRARRRRPAWLALAAPHTILAAIQPPLPLPPPPTERAARLIEAIASIQQRFGPHAIGYGRPPTPAYELPTPAYA